MAGDIGYSSERFGRALSYLALHEGTYRERLQEALAEAHHSVDGESGRPIPGVPTGAITFGSKPDPQTLELGAEVDGQVLSAGRYTVSADGKTLTVTNKGTGLKGPFEVVMVMERVVR